MGMEIKDGRLIFRSLSSHVALSMDRRKGYGYGDGFDMLRICAADPDDRKPVEMFRLNQDTLNMKELSFNVI